mgnify:CR=1 FL=1
MSNKFLDFLIAKKLGKKPLTPHALSFNLIPYINAVQRSSDQQAKHDLFMAFATGDNQDAAYKQMNAAYRIQRETMDRMVEQLSRQADVQVANGDHALFVRMANEDAGFGGLAANKLKSKYGLPVFCLRDVDPLNWSGSMRSDCDGLDMVNASGLAKCSGHQKACGVMIKRANFERFRTWANQQDWGASAEYEVAACLDIADITLELCEQLEQYGHLWGKDVPCPLMYSELTIPPNTTVLCGKAGNTFRYPPFIKFGCNEQEMAALVTNSSKKLQLIYELSVNEYGGERYPQAKIVDWEIEDMDEPDEAEFDWDSVFS